MKKRKPQTFAELLEATFSPREQATLLTRMKASLLEEDAKQRKVSRVPGGRRRLGAFIEGRPENETSHPDAVQAAREARLTMPRSLSAQPGRQSYWAQLGEAPDCAPGDTGTAMVFYRKVLSAIDQGGWTPSERAGLHDLEHKWGARARGEDPRFMVVGTKAGRLDRKTEAAIRARRDAVKGNA